MKTRIIRTKQDLERASKSLLNLEEYLPIKLTVDNYKPTRSVEQNSKLWATLTEISQQVEWYGQKLSPEDWKAIFSASLKGQRSAPGLDGGFVVFGHSTSKMTVPEMMDMIELMYSFGAEHDVVFKE